MSTFVYLLELDKMNSCYQLLCKKCKKKYGHILDVRNINCTLVQYGLYKEYGRERDIIICKSENGAPYIQNEDTRISLSHGKKMTGCAFSDNCVGLDIQEVIKYKLGYADFLLSAYEKDILKSSEDKDLFLTTMWTLKEAYGKYLNVGLKYDFARTGFDYSLSVEHTVNGTVYKSEQLHGSVISCVSKDSSVYYEVGIEELLRFIIKTS